MTRKTRVQVDRADRPYMVEGVFGKGKKHKKP